LKYQLEMSGIEYPKTHDIDQLLRIGKENGAELLVTEYIEDHSEMFSLWEARTRYVLNYHLEERKIDAALKGVKELLDKTSEI
jgi:HEPN domain-containing protein